MTYKQALNIGAVAAGAVKCTYALLYDENGEKLFSLQRIDGQYEWIPDEEFTERMGQTALVRRPDLSQADTSAYYYSSLSKTGEVVMPDILVVRADKYYEGLKRVPVYLTDAAIEWIEACCPRNGIDVFTKTGKRVRTFWDLSGDNNEILQGYLDRGYTCSRTFDNRRIYDIIDNNKPVYVKPDALFWTIEKLPENKELEELRAKYEQAKKILLASLPTALI